MRTTPPPRRHEGRTIRRDVNTEEAQHAFAQLAYAHARENFWQFRVTMNPKLTLRDQWFPATLARRLRVFWEDLRAGKRPVMLVQTPPQHGKSISVIDFIGWSIGLDPELRVIYSSFSDRLGIRANLRLQRMMSSREYKSIFPGTYLTDKHVVTLAEHYLRNHEVLEFVGHEGYFRNTTVLGSITGESLDLGVVDDPIKGRAEANSELQREKVWHWLTDDVFSRFSEKAGLLMIMTRWHLDDPAGRLIEHFGNKVTVVRYPAIAEHDEYIDGELVRHKGEPLFPALKSMEFLQERRKLYTESSWEALYQQNPIISGGGIFPIERLKVLEIQPDRSKIQRSVRYVDKAATEDGGAYTAMVLMHMMQDKTYVIEHVARGQWSSLEREERIKFWAKHDRALLKTSYEVGVEQEPGSGGKESAESTIRNLAGFRAFADKVTGDKVIRAEPFAAQVQNGSVSVVAGAWVHPLLSEMEYFPNGKFVDQVDACSGAFNRLISGPSYNLAAPGLYT